MGDNRLQKMALLGELIRGPSSCGGQHFCLAQATLGGPRSVWHRHQKEGAGKRAGGQMVRQDGGGGRTTVHLDEWRRGQGGAKGVCRRNRERDTVEEQVEVKRARADGEKTSGGEAGGPKGAGEAPQAAECCGAWWPLKLQGRKTQPSGSGCQSCRTKATVCCKWVAKGESKREQADLAGRHPCD